MLSRLTLLALVFFLGCVTAALAEQAILFVQSSAGVIVPWPLDGSGIPKVTCS